MARKRKVTIDNLSELVDVYSFRKTELDEKKSECDRLNKQIKEDMAELDITSAEGTDVVANIVVQNRESVNTEKMAEILCKYWTDTKSAIEVCPYIKVQYCVDTDELEKAIYHGEIPSEVLLQLEDCKTVNKVTTLRLAKKKGD